ncbi:DUF4148 domain-containing protein [Enterobacter hormaechei]|uniref:DUF4148 domain-containing protein n=1 Tax=Enterobacter hormaechei TaxID=158836 RepID=UPI003750C139
MKFNIKKISIALATIALTTTAAIAQPSPQNHEMMEITSISQKTRAQVIEEVKKAREDGTLEKIGREAGYAPEIELQSGHSAKTREQVIQELQNARASGELERMGSEAGYAPEFYSNIGQESSGLSRSEVIQQVIAARKDGLLDKIGSEAGYAPEIEAGNQMH